MIVMSSFTSHIGMTTGTTEVTTSRDPYPGLPAWATFARKLVESAFTNPHAQQPVVTSAAADKRVEADAPAIGMQPAELLETIRRSYAPTPAPTPIAPMRLKNRWSGVVDRITDDIFEARFSELGHEELQYQGEFLVSSLSDEDKQILRPGVPFYAIRSDVQVVPGHWQETTVVQLRRLGQVTTESIDRATEQGAQWAALLRESVHVTDDA